MSMNGGSLVKHFDLIVFDWDGTLMDSAGAIVASIQAAARDMGLEPPPDARARHIIGLGLGDALRHVLPELEEGRYADLTDRYRYHYLAQDHELTLFEGIVELLDELAAAGHVLAVATGKSRLGLDRAIGHSGLGHYFQASRCADECFSKPHPQMLEELMVEFAVPPEATLMIGDTTHDLQMAENAGVAAVAVSYGAHTVDALQGVNSLYCAPTVADLRVWLKANA
jgi:phosphoglycolate phosphatase